MVGVINESEDMMSWGAACHHSALVKQWLGQNMDAV